MREIYKIQNPKESQRNKIYCKKLNIKLILKLYVLVFNNCCLIYISGVWIDK